MQQMYFYPCNLPTIFDEYHKEDDFQSFNLGRRSFASIPVISLKAPLANFLFVNATRIRLPFVDLTNFILTITN